MKDQKVTSKPTKKIKADTIISVLMDMSGSMAHLTNATLEGLNSYLETQRKDKSSDEVVVSITVFDSSWNEVHVTTPFNLVPLSELPEITTKHYHPRGGTPLYDAIGTVVERTEKALEGIEGNPDVLLVIITDGEENSSLSLSQKDAKVLIENKQGEGWTPVYLGANHDAWQAGNSLGIAAGNTQTYAATVAGVKDTVFKDLGVRTSAHRKAKSALYGSSGAKSSGLLGSYRTDSFFAGDSENMDEIVSEMTKTAKLGDEESKDDA